MPKTKMFVLALVITAIIGIAGYKAITKDNEQETAYQSRSVLLAEALRKGEPVWLLFHSTTCQSCIEMEKIFYDLAPEFKGKIAFIEVNVNDLREQRMVSDYKIEYIPKTYLLNKNGEVAFDHVGLIPKDEMREKLKSLLERQ